MTKHARSALPYKTLFPPSNQPKNPPSFNLLRARFARPHQSFTQHFYLYVHKTSLEFLVNSSFIIRLFHLKNFRPAFIIRFLFSHIQKFLNFLHSQFFRFLILWPTRLACIKRICIRVIQRYFMGDSSLMF